MAGDAASSESHSLRGPIDRAALGSIRDAIEREEPLAAPALDDVVDPRVLEVRLDDGLCDADSARLDVRWTTRDDYAFHYTDAEGVDLRWDRHPHDGDDVAASGPAHYHPPPSASSDPADVEASCIGHSRPLLVTRAVLQLWRRAYEAGSLAPLNAGRDPP